MLRPARFLLIMMVLSAVLSAILANDIVCLAFTPVLAISLLRAGLNPVPFLIGLAVSSNIGSAATIIGNPQNMLIGQVGQLHFGSSWPGVRRHPFYRWPVPMVDHGCSGAGCSSRQYPSLARRRLGRSLTVTRRRRAWSPRPC